MRHLLRRNTHASAAAAFLLCLIFAGAAAQGQAPVSEVHVSTPSTYDLRRLVEGGFNIDAVHGQDVTVYADDGELDLLRAMDFSILSATAETKAAAGYPTFDDITADLEAYASAHPAICRLTSLGQSVEGRELWALLITANPDTEEDEPEFKYVSTMHGNEPLGTVLSLYFIDLLLTEYGSDDRITGLVDTTAIWMVPLMNPDGYADSKRYNAEGLDLNRSFPQYGADFFSTYYDGEAMDDEDRTAEVGHIMRWTAQNSFTLSANLHTGTIVVNYPYDNDGFASGVNAPSPDDALFQYISRQYSVNNPAMWNSLLFEDGITNGSAWYIVDGGMQDWNYRYAACNEVTIELAYDKSPSADTFADYWEDNEEAMLSYLETAHLGIRGLVTDKETGEPLWARIDIEDNEHPVCTDADIGDYHRMLLPGTYAVSASARGYVPRSQSGVVVAEGPATRVDFTLTDADINNDDALTAVDVQLVVNALLGIEVPYNCDVDGGGVSSTDLQNVINVVLES